MHDSDLVETLAALNQQERERFFAFLKNEAAAIPLSTATINVAVMVHYIFECLDKHHKNLSKQHIWSSLPTKGEFNEEMLDTWTTTVVDEVREILKKDFKKRLASTQKELNGLIAILTIQERQSLLNRFDQNEFPDKLTLYQLLDLQCRTWNEYETSLSEQEIYPLLFGAEKEVVGKLPKHRSDILKIVRRFIALETSRNQMSELQEWVLLQKFFQERNCISQYQRIRNLILHRKKEQTQWSPLDYYQIFSSEKGESDYQGDRNEATTDQNLWETMQSLDEYYLVERLWLTCLLLDQNQTTPLALPPFEDWFHFNLNSSHLKWFFEKPIGRIFVLAIRLLTDEDGDEEQEFRNFIEFLVQHEKSFSDKLISSFEAIACNYGIRRMNRGNFAYGELVFGLQQRYVEKGRIYTEGKILSNEFQSITILGLRLGKFDWVREFIEKHKKRVVGMMPSMEYYQFCLALFYYSTHDLLSALHILMNSDYEDLQSRMPARILEIKVLCDLELSGQTKLRIDEQLDARIEAGILFFFRLKEVPQQKKKMGKRFMDFMKKIIRAKENRRWNILEKIRKEVETIDYIAERQWLLKTIDQYLAQAKKK